MKRQLLAFGVVLLLIALFGSGTAEAQANLNAPTASMQGLLDIIKNQADQWNGALKSYATTVFWSLTTITFVWVFFPLVMKGADLSEIGGTFIRFILTTGFFNALLLHTQDWASAIVESFRIAAAHAGGIGDKGLNASDIFGLAVSIADKMMQVETWNPLVAVSVAFCAAVTLICFTFIAAFVAVTVIESYIVINAAVFFMGFGGSPWTKDYAIAMLRYAVAVGAKLFVLTLLVGLIIKSAEQWMAAYSQDDASMWTMVGLGCVCAYLCKTVPELIAGIISGVSPGGGNMVGQMAQIAAVAATAAAAAATGGAAGAAAGSSASGGGAGGLGSLAGGMGASPAGGSGGLANALKSSLANGPSAAPGGGSGGDGAMSAAKASAPRIGGGAASAPAPASGGGGSSSVSSASGPVQDATSASASSGGGAEDNAISAAGGDPSSVVGTDDGSMAAQADAAAEESAAPPQEGAHGSQTAGQGGDAADSPAAAPQEQADAGKGAGQGNDPAAAPDSAKADAERAAMEARAKLAGANARSAMLRGAVRTSGMMAALSVPGMENAASLSLGPKMPGSSPSDSDAENGEGEPDFKSEQVENTIAPAASPAPGATTAPAAAPVEAPTSGNPSSSAPKDGDA